MGAKVTIVGGGLGGLVAAVAAAEAGWTPVVLEARPRLGGRAVTLDGPYRANWGPHVIYGDGPLWAWLDQRQLAGGAHRAPVAPRARFRVDGRLRRLPPLAVVRAARHLRRHEAPVDRSFLAWAGDEVGPEAAARLAAYAGVATFHHDPGRLSAAFLNQILRRATAIPPTVRYLPGGWGTLIERLAERARRRGAELVTGARVDRLPDAPVVLAVPLAISARLLGEPALATVPGTTTALLDIGLTRRRGDPYLVSDLDAPGFVETFSIPDPTLAPPGHHLVQGQTGMRPGETLDQAVGRLEAVVDLGYCNWRDREQWRRRARVHHQTGALDPPGRTWQDRPAVHHGDGVYLVGDEVGAPGLLSEVALNSAVAAVGHLTTTARQLVD